jgi:hypothetical protein
MTRTGMLFGMWPAGNFHRGRGIGIAILAELLCKWPMNEAV